MVIPAMVSCGYGWTVPQVSSIKIQGSIHYAPESPHTERVRLTEAVDAAIGEVLEASSGSIKLRRRPIEGSSEMLRNSFPGKIMLFLGWNKELRRVESFFF
jgi:hypothetical protein